MESIQLKYHEEAKSTGVYVISACGLDALPTELGTNLLKDAYSPGILNSIENFISSEDTEVTVNHGTWDSLIEAVKNRSDLSYWRKRLFKEFYTKKEPKFKYPLIARTLPFKSSRFNKFCIPFWESDTTCVRRSQLLAFQEYDEKPTQFQEYYMADLRLLLLLGMIGVFFLILCPFDIGRRMLKNYPYFYTFGMIPKDGPTKEQIEHSCFKMTMIAKGWDSEPPQDGTEYDQPPNKKMVLEITGPNPGYETTAICMIQSGITILEESDKMPFNGGVLTPGFAFRRTSIVDRLKLHSLCFKSTSESI
jgi:saccharopine dehydrogenase-like